MAIILMGMELVLGGLQILLSQFYEMSVGMNITYVFQDEYPWDIRVDKIVNSLLREGYTCQIVSRNRSGILRYEKMVSGLRIYRLPKPSCPVLATFVNTPAFFSPFWFFEIVRAVSKNNSRLIIVRDLPLSLTAVLVGKLLSVPVMLDMAEDYPSMIADTWLYRGPKLIELFIRNPYFLRWLERFVLPKLAHVLVVSSHSKKRIEALNVNPQCISVVGNTPRIVGEYDNSKLNFIESIRSENTSILLYVGGLEESRGLEIVVRALPYVAHGNFNVKFVIVGEGSSRKNLEELSVELGVERNVYFAGWQKPTNVPSIIRSADVCIIPHYVTKHINTTIPNKIFDYMLQKKPVIVTNSKSLAEIVKSCKCGYVYNHVNPKELAKVLQKILSNRGLREKLGEAGYKKVKEQFNWAVDEKILFLAIEKMLLA